MRAAGVSPLEQQFIVASTTRHVDVAAFANPEPVEVSLDDVAAGMMASGT